MHPTTQFEYASQSRKPDWFGQHSDWLYFSSTSGNSPRNEWFGFDCRASAIDFCESDERFRERLDEKILPVGSDYYFDDQVTSESLESAEDADDYVLIEDAIPAPLEKLLEARSNYLVTTH